MTVGQKNSLRDRIVGILRKSAQPLRTPEIEHRLKVEGEWKADTFDVRDAVSALIAEGQAEFVHPGYLVRLIEKK
jgi:hypothetical protein